MRTSTHFRTRACALILAGALTMGQLAACSLFGGTEATEAPTTPETTSYTTRDDGTGTSMVDDGEMYVSDEPSYLSAEGAEAGMAYEPFLYTEDFSTEEYAALTEGGFVSTLVNPLSTVSADVDTASWCNLRRMVREGYGLAGSQDEAWRTIPAGAVRIEEMLNYFSYDYEAPRTGERFSVSAQLGPCPWNSETELLTLGFATAPEDVASLRGRNLVFLIDVSGSMDSEDKLELLQDSFAMLLEQLDENDRVSIVTYASGEELVLEAEPGDHDREILRAIYRLHAGGSTNGERGLELAYEVAERNFIEGGVNRIILASDGDLNVGMTSESDLHDYVSGKRETGVYLSVLGFGSGNYKDTKMETLADDGNGSYHYIDCIEEAERVFGERLCANLVPFADDVKVQVEFNPALVKGYRLIGYENREMADEDFRDDTVDAGDVGPGAQFTVAYEIVRADSSFEIAEPELRYQETSYTGSDEWLTVALRYHAFDDDEVHEQELSVSEGAWEADPGADWRFQAAVIEAGMLMRDSEYAGTSSFEDLRALVGAEPSAERAAFLEVMDELAKNSGQ